MNHTSLNACASSSLINLSIRFECLDHHKSLINTEEVVIKQDSLAHSILFYLYGFYGIQQSGLEFEHRFGRIIL